MPTRLDHLVIGAGSLEQGVDYVGDLLGVDMPYGIEWHTDEHPSSRMADLGCRLHSLEIHHPYASWLQSTLESIGAANLVQINALPKDETPYLKAYIATPKGLRELSGKRHA